MQKYTKINATDYVKDTLLTLNDMHETLISNNSGEAFPTANLYVGMSCYRTDLNKKYTLKSISPLSWVLTEDLDKDAYNAETLGGKPMSDFAEAEHGNHVPEIEEVASEKRFLRNDNTWQDVIPANIGAAPTSHVSADTTYGRATASNYGHAMASSATPLVAGTATVGTDNGKFAREGHVHPSQTTVSGNAGTATNLAASKTFAVTGAVTGSVSSNLSGNLSIGTTLAPTSSSTNITVTASTQAAIVPTLTGSALSGTLLTQSTGVPAGTRTLQATIQELVNRSHIHGTKAATAANCNCACDGSNSN